VLTEQGHATAPERHAYHAGLLGLVLMFAGFFAVDEGGSEPATAPAAVLVREITDHETRIVIGSILGMVGAALLVWFASALPARLARAGGHGEIVGRTAHSFGVIMAAGALIHGSFRLACASAADPVALTDAIRALAVLHGWSTGVLAWGAIGLVLTLSVATSVHRILPTGFAYAGALLAVLTVALLPTDHGGVGLALFVWLGAACWVLSGRSVEVPEPGTT
jgi:hypothetical protein